MSEFEIMFWYWWVLAVAFLGLEILVSGFFFLWLAVSGFVVGVLAWLLPAMSFEMQLLLFSLLAIVTVMAWRRYAAGRSPASSDHPLLNRRGAQYVGRTFDVSEAIVNGQGKIKVDDGLWKVRGEDCPAGSKVKVVAVNGTVFEVERCP